MKYLEILVSLIFIFLLLSMFSSIIMEFISTFFRMRASTLQKSIAKILGATSVDEKIVREFYEVPLIKMIGEDTNAFFSIFKKGNLPHQIDSKTFKDAILYMSKNGKSEDGITNKTSPQGTNETTTEAAV
ncbi:MAG TPA: hypothetical protein PLU10_08160, partial [Chitinophagaceae bacterium]|nr:hypothetical protein [Chitinophagaceae bacterium]